MALTSRKATSKKVDESSDPRLAVLAVAAAEL